MDLSARKEWNGIEVGCDEAGRGCLAGPVTAAAVALPRTFRYASWIDDSKQLSAHKRNEARHAIEQEALAWRVVHIPPRVIDSINILEAAILGMQIAVEGLPLIPSLLLVDGNKFHAFNGIPHECIIKGDSRYLNIAAASILAKTHRDHLMQQLAKEFPVYDWHSNKGYPTKAHRQAIAQYGRCIWHRASFR